MQDGLCKSCRMKVWTCVKCKKQYKSIYERDMCIECEQSNMHIICKICGKTFKTKKSLSNHARYHDDSYMQMMSDKQRGRTFSEETKKKMSEARTGSKDSKHTRYLKSEAMKKKWASPGYKERYHECHYGKSSLSDETKKRLSAIRKEAWQSGPYKQHQLESLQNRRMQRYIDSGYSEEAALALEDRSTIAKVISDADGDFDIAAKSLNVTYWDIKSSFFRMGLQDEVNFKDRRESGPERHWECLLNKSGLDFEKQGHPYNDNHCRCDFINEEHRFCIEIDPSYTHSTFGKHKIGSTSKDYHYIRSIEARDNGYEVFHIWDWLDEDKCLAFIKSKLHKDEHKIAAKRCELVKVSSKQANEFFDRWHLQGGLKNGQSECYALAIDDELITVMTYGKSRFDKHYEWECLRSCTKGGWHVYGALSRLQKTFLDEVKPKSLITYTDFSRSCGKSNEKIDRELIRMTGPSLVWYDYSSMYRDTLVRAKGANALLGTSYGSRVDTGLGNNDIMQLEGFNGIYDCGSAVYRLA